MKHSIRPIRFFLVVLACLGGGAADRLRAAESIPETVEPIVVDGVLDEPVWRISAPVEVDYLGSKQGQKSAEKRMVAQYAWDGDYLYIGYETFDANLLAKGDGRRDGPEGNRRPGASIHDPVVKVDVVEFFISFGDERFMWEIHHNALDQFNDVFCIVPAPEWPVAKGTLTTYGIMFLGSESLQDDPPHTVATAVKLKPKADGAASTPNRPGDTDTGYTAEIRIPWRALGIPTAARTWRQENGKKVPGPWKLETQKVSLLAVVQDGDLPERYHHSSPTRKPDWFHKTQPDWPVYAFGAAAEPAVPTGGNSPAAAVSAEMATIRGLLAGGEPGPPPAETVEALRSAGITSALAAAAFLDEARPAEAEWLTDIIAATAICRRMHPEMLRIYQPAAYDLFYGPTAAASQQPLAVGLGWQTWPRLLPEAVVRGAPLPTIAWLKAQAASKTPDLANLRLLFPALGWWLRADNERHHAAEFRTLIAALADNPAVVADLSTASALLRLIAEARAVAAADWVIGMLRSTDEGLRQTAAVAIGRLAGQADPAGDFGRRALAAWLGQIRAERSPAVLAALAEAAEAWPDSREASTAVRDVFVRSTDPAVQRSILLAVANTRWPDRQVMIRQALESSSGSVLGAALDAAAVHPDASFLPAIMELLAEQPKASPQLIDAVGGTGDAEALGTLLGWLKRERNPALRLKLILAIHRIPGDLSDRVLTDLLAQVAEPLEADLLCRIASQRNMPGAARFLRGLAEDVTAPVEIRARAIWALGAAADPDSRESLRRLSVDTAKYFPDLAAKRLIPEALEQARLFIDLARLRQGDATVEADVVRRFEAATPATRVAVLRSLAEIRLDSPLIAASLESGDYAVLEAAVRAAAAADPATYAARLEVIRESPFITALLDSGLDTGQLQAAFAAPRQAGTTLSEAP